MQHEIAPDLRIHHKQSFASRLRVPRGNYRTRLSVGLLRLLCSTQSQHHFLTAPRHSIFKRLLCLHGWSLSTFNTVTGIKFCRILESAVETRFDHTPASSNINFSFFTLHILKKPLSGISFNVSTWFDHSAKAQIQGKGEKNHHVSHGIAMCQDFLFWIMPRSGRNVNPSKNVWSFLRKKNREAVFSCFSVFGIL